MNTVFDSMRCRQLRIPGPAATHRRIDDGQQLPRHRRQRRLRTSVEDPLQHTTNSTYDKLNRLSTVTDALNETTTYNYDANGNEISVTNPLDLTTQYGYDAANRQTRNTNALNQTTTIGYDAAGEKTSVTDPLDHTTTYGYTLLGQLALVTDPLGDKFAYGYDAYGDQVAITQGGPSNPSMTASMVYNKDHEEVNYIDYMGNTYTYTYDADGNQTTIIDPNKNTTTKTYNQIDELSSVEDAMTNVTNYGYDADGNRTTVEDPLKRITTTVYDAQGRVLTVTNPFLNGTTTYVYDGAGNRTSIEDPDSNTTTYTYDAVNRLSSTINPMGYTATYDYNAAGEMTTMTDADGRTIAYSYDAVGRKIGETWVNGGYAATWTYDAGGRLTNAQDTYSSYQYGYDAANRLTSVNNSGTPGVPQVTLTYGYDNYNDRTGLTDSLGDKVSYSFNNDKLVTGIEMMSSGVSQTLYAEVTFGYDPGSRQTTITRSPGDAIDTTLTYNYANRLTNMVTADTTAGVTLANYTYVYDNASQLTGYQDNNNSSLSYSYDPNGELTGASGTLNGSSYAVTYSYDANGNRNMTGYTTGKGNELTTDGTYDYTYDNNGNLLTQKDISTGVVTTYTWDYRNRLTEVQVGSSTETFTYDVNNNRIGVSQNGTQQLYTVYDGSNPYIDFNSSGTLTERYLTNPNALNQFYGQVNGSGTAQWFLTDNINSIRQVVSTSGGIQDAITYNPYGGIITQTYSANAPRFLYAGGAYDSITGNFQDDARYYNPTAGRWLSQDPLGLRPDSNPYRYVDDKPTYGVDPTGLEGIIGVPGGKLPKGVSYVWPEEEDGEFWIANLRLPDFGRAYSEFDNIIFPAAQFPWSNSTGFWGNCDLWVEKFQCALQRQGLNQQNNYLQMDMIRLYNVFCLGWWTGIGHAVVKVRFPDGQVVYFDDGNIGGTDHLFFPNEMPSYYVIIDVNQQVNSVSLSSSAKVF